MKEKPLQNDNIWLREGLSEMHGKSRTREGAGPQAPASGSVVERASSNRRGGCTRRGRTSAVRARVSRGVRTTRVTACRILSGKGSSS